MRQAGAVTTIQASPDAIWAIITHAEGYPEWEPTVERIEGRIALGETIKAHTKLAPGRAFPVKVSEFEPGRRMVWRGGMPLGLFTGVRTFTLTPQSDGSTEVRIQEVFSGPLLPLLAGSLPDMGDAFRQFCAGLKQKAEGHS